MKVSVSLSEAELSILDEYARATGVGSRSAAVQAAIRLLREASLEDAYVEAFDDWAGSADALLWDAAAGDGLGRATG
jgi:Arc/MetJ-type ribon-helix-helix transcriptional regulator